MRKKINIFLLFFTFILCLSFVNASASDNLLEVHFIDVGQGDSILIRSDDEAMLIDAGENDKGRVVVEYLRQQGINELKYLIGTHPHSDHSGGLDTVLKNIKVDNVIMPNATNSTRTFEEVLDAIEDNDLEITLPEVGDTYKIGLADFIILSPNSETYKNLNNYSVGIKLIYGNTAFVMCGDAEEEAEKEIVNNGIDLKANVLKLGHHGSRTSSSLEFFNAVDPEICIVSCGLDNSYGHPHQETLKKIVGKTVYRTDEEGSIILLSDGVNIIKNDEVIDTSNATETTKASEELVYKTKTGTKYHRDSCTMLSNSKIELTKKEAIAQGLEPCKVCNP